MKSEGRDKMLRWNNGKMEVIDGVEEVNTLCDLFKVPEDVRADMIREEEKKRSLRAHESPDR